MQSRKITKCGGLTIPRLLRQALGISAGSAVDIEVNNETLTVTKHLPTCRICGSQDRVISYKEFEICNKCSDEISRGFDKCR